MAGQCIILMGVSGTGKTTVGQALAGRLAQSLLTATTFIHGRTSSKWPPASRLMMTIASPAGAHRRRDFQPRAKE